MALTAVCMYMIKYVTKKNKSKRKGGRRREERGGKETEKNESQACATPPIFTA